MRPSSRRALFACACLGMLAFGIVLTTLGAVLPSVIVRFGIDKAAAGALFLLMTFGILAGSLVFGPIVDRHGYRGMLAAATAFIIVGLEGIAFARGLDELRAAVVIIGLGGGVINGGANALVADISTEGKGANLNLLGVFFGIGAMGVPFVLGALSGAFSHAAVLAAVGALVIVPLVVIMLTHFPAPKQAQGFPIAAAGRLFREPLLLLMGLMLFLESGIEITVGGWTSTFVKEELAVPERSALFLLSLYWMGMMLARLALGAILRRVSPFRVLYSCITIALIGTALLLSTERVAVAAIGVFLVGAGLAATFPTVLGFIGDRYAALSGTAFSLAIAMALVGGMLLPYAAGVLGGRYGLRGSLLIVPAALVTLTILLGILSRRLRAISNV
jgi:MFS transporter, FHS family, glucose/mannose:H+ symporter